MTNCIPTLRTRCLAALMAVALIAALPVSATASDPATDQYAPSTPGGGGDVPVNENDGDFTGGDSGGTASGGNSSGSGGGTPAPTPTAPAPAPATGDPATSSQPSTSSSSGGGDGRGGEKSTREEQTVGGFAAQAAQDRKQVAEAASAPSDLVRSESDDGGGLGPFLWVVLGLTLAGALMIGFTGRREGGHPA